MTSTPATEEPLVHVAAFRMAFGSHTVIDDLSFDVRQGETFGLLGSNGSGKTTTIRSLLGIYRATSGTLHINGRDFRARDGSRLGYLPEERGLYKKESVLDVMTYFGRLKGMTRSDARSWSVSYLERTELVAHQATRLDRLSSGQQQKVQLGVTIMNRPELLILDEPTKGFDPINRNLLMEIVQEQKNVGATVIMVTHQMEEVERLCDRVILLKNGRAEAYGTVSDIQDLYGGRTIRIHYAGEIPDSPHYRIALRQRNYAELKFTDETDESMILRELVEHGLAIREFTTGKMSLNEIFLQVYGSDAVAGRRE